MGNVQQYIGKRVDVGRYHVEVVKYLGEGGSSFIFLVKDVQRESAKPMVLKRLVAENDAAFALLQNEIDMHQRFRHPQIVEFYASQVVKKPKGEREVFILMEYCASGHLYDNMTKMGAKRFSEKDLLRLFRSLCVYEEQPRIWSPVSVLHAWDPPIAHRDLKLENFLLAQNGVYKLCDFGSCVDGPQRLTTKADRARQAEHVLKRTTAMYRSPELADVEGTAMFGSAELTEAVDLWAMGCVLYTMAFFKPPFPPDGLRTERYTVPKDSKYSSAVHQLIARMLLADVERRATIGHVIACLDALLQDEPLPPPDSAPAPASPVKTTSVVSKTPPPCDGSLEASRGARKAAEARKESVPQAKTASDLLDMDFNPTITPLSAKADAFSGGSTAHWTNTAAASADTGAFADFANFPTSLSTFSGATSAGSASFDAFGFPASPGKAAAAAPTSFGVTSPAPPQAMAMQPPAPAADPFAGLGGHGTAPPQMGGYHPQQQQQQGLQQGYGIPQHQPQSFQQPMVQQQHSWGQQQQLWGQQQQPHAQTGGFPRGF